MLTSVKYEKQNSHSDKTIKCGEVVFANNTKFCFSCTFCCKNFEKCREFFQHVLDDHLNYYEDYLFDENDDLLPGKLRDPHKIIGTDGTEFVGSSSRENLNKKKNIGFSNHFEEYVSKLTPNTVSIKSEDEEDENEDYKEDIEEFEFFLDDQPSQTIQSPSPTFKNDFEDILHIEFLEEASENEYEPENMENSEVESVQIKPKEEHNDDDEDGIDEYREDDDNNNAEEANSPESDNYLENANESEEDEKKKKLPLLITKDKETKKTKYKCTYPHCKKVFATKNGAKRHIQNVHYDTQSRACCKTCGKTFRTHKFLENHMLRHLGIKPHPCEICGQAFSDKSNLNVHIQRHKGIKPHVCALCQKRFHSSTEVKLHMRSHTGERPFVCELCGKKFSNSGHLCSHRRRHYNEKNFECEVCHKRFFDRKLLNDHKIMHSDERPFECSTCGATFQRKKALLQHDKLHSDIKQYVCKICGKSFAQNAGLYSHMKGH